MRNSLLVAISMLALAACHQSDVQGRYNEDRSACRAFAEERQSRIGSKGNVAIRNAELVTLFSDCMAKNGWQVATPRREARAGGTPDLAKEAAIASANRGNEPATVPSLPTSGVVATAPRQNAAVPLPRQPVAAQPYPPRPVYQQPVAQPQPQAYAPRAYQQPAPQQAAPRYQPPVQQPPANPYIRQIPEENYF